MQTKTIETNKNQVIKKCYSQLDKKAMTTLNDKLNKMLKTNICLKKEFIETMSYAKRRAQIKMYCNKNLVKHCGIFQLGLKAARLQDFGVHVYEIVEYDNTLPPEKQIFKTIGYSLHVVFDIRYELINGGTNGITFLSADYDYQTKTWTFYPSK